jgi:alanine-synthesizing transaminase
MFADRTNWNLAANRLSEALAAHRASGKALLDLTISNPTECGFIYDEQQIRHALANPASMQYAPDPRGMRSARAAVTEYYAERGAQVDPDAVFLTTSTSEAYSFVFRLLCNPGDEALIPVPGYPLFDFLADLHDVRLIRYPLLYDHGWQIDFQGLEKAVGARARAVIVVHPNNPTGHFTKPAETRRLNEICATNELALIADEVFLDFGLANETATSFAANRDVLTFTMSGLSKISGLPQMKAAWLIVTGPQERKARAISRLEVIADTYLSMNAPIQLAAPAFLRQRHAFQKQVMDRVRENLGELDRQLAAQHASGRLKVEGGWYVVIRLPVTCDDEEFAVDLLQTKQVYLHPGSFYDLPKGHVVLSLITPAENFAAGATELLSSANE